MLPPLPSTRRAAQRWHKFSRKSTNLRRGLVTSADTKEALRTLLRETAQPVAVVTSFYPLNGANDDTQTRFHGATLSSFSSIALDPHPLIAFSLKIPSRMANSLKTRMSGQFSQTPNLVLNLLSSTQATTAMTFARPDLYPNPFQTVEHELTEEGLPVLSGSLGALSCSVLSCIPLQTLAGGEVQSPSDGSNLVSELFISRVLRVETMLKSGLPLLYHRRQYVSTGHSYAR